MQDRPHGSAIWRHMYRIDPCHFRRPSLSLRLAQFSVDPLKCSYRLTDSGHILVATHLREGRVFKGWPPTITQLSRTPWPRILWDSYTSVDTERPTLRGNRNEIHQASTMDKFSLHSVHTRQLTRELEIYQQREKITLGRMASKSSSGITLELTRVQLYDSRVSCFARSEQNVSMIFYVNPFDVNL